MPLARRRARGTGAHIPRDPFGARGIKRKSPGGPDGRPEDGDAIRTPVWLPGRLEMIRYPQDQAGYRPLQCTCVGRPRQDPDANGITRARVGPRAPWPCQARPVERDGQLS